MKKTSIHLSAFGPFRDITENPSMLLASCIQAENRPEVTSVTVLDVTVASVAKFFDDHKSDSIASRVVYLHLGVSNKAPCFHLEGVAKNFSDFGPDGDNSGLKMDKIQKSQRNAS